MSTTFILHGGETKTSSPANNRFFSQFTSLVDKDEVNILMCYWCRDKSKWQTVFDRDTKRVLGETEKKVNFAMPQNPADLKQLIDSYDVLYIAGGPAEPIEALYPELTWLKQKLDGKVYLGSSMGAFLASESYVLSYDAQDSLSVHQGLGMLPINCLVHWDQEDKKTLKIKLLQKISDRAVLVLDEGESVRLIG
jgi:hypothetical protein